MQSSKIAVFKGKEIRKTVYNNEWWFSVIEALTGTNRARKYWSDLKKKLIDEGYSEVSDKIGQLKLQAPDGKMRNTDCANTETIFRLIQSIPYGFGTDFFHAWRKSNHGNYADQKHNGFE